MNIECSRSYNIEPQWVSGELPFVIAGVRLRFDGLTIPGANFPRAFKERGTLLAKKHPMENKYGVLLRLDYEARIDVLQSIYLPLPLELILQLDEIADGEFRYELSLNDVCLTEVNAHRCLVHA